MADPSIRIRSWVRGTTDDERAGLLGYLTLYVGNLVVDGVTVRRTATGRLALSFPERRDKKGRAHAIVRPVDDAARREIEAIIFGAATLAAEVER